MIPPEVLISADRIQQRVDELARQMMHDYQGRKLTIVGVLTGSLLFLADLMRRLDLPLRIALIQASSYRGAVTRPGALDSAQRPIAASAQNAHVVVHQ